jgi:lipoteichoic acid synthase
MKMEKTRLLKKIKNSHITFFAIAVVLFWIKTYIAYQIVFKLGINDNLQKFLLAINPISSALFFLGLALLSKKHTKKIMIIINFILSFLLYANIVYYRFFNDFVNLIKWFYYLLSSFFFLILV